MWCSFSSWRICSPFSGYLHQIILGDSVSSCCNFQFHKSWSLSCALFFALPHLHSHHVHQWIALFSAVKSPVSLTSHLINRFLFYQQDDKLMPQKVVRNRVLFSPHLSNLGKDIFIPTDPPTNLESKGVVIGGFKPAYFQSTTASRSNIMARPSGFLPLVPYYRSRILCRKIMCPRTMITVFLTTHVSCTQ